MACETVSSLLASMPIDICLHGVGSYLDGVSLRNWMCSCSRLHESMYNDDEAWVDRASLVLMKYAGLVHITRGEGERAYNWYLRIQRGLVSSEQMVRAHLDGARPYMCMHGCFDEHGHFTCLSPMRFPASHGLIGELMNYQAAAGSKNFAFDALAMLSGELGGCDTQLRNIHGTMRDLVRRGRNRPNKLASIMAYIEALYMPKRQPSGPPQAMACLTAVVLNQDTDIRYVLTKSLNIK